MRKIHRRVLTVVTVTILGSLTASADAAGQAQALQSAAINEYNAINHPVVGRSGMVASQNADATRVGVEIMRQGGNAIDAAVAVGLALAVTLPRAGNLGGGGFMLVHLAEEGRTVAVDFREVAPALAHRDMYFGSDGGINDEEYRFSHKSSGVPGTVAGLDHILREYGTMSWAEVVEPAIRLARDGIVVTDDLANNLRASKSRLTQNPAAAEAFYKADGSEYEVGEILRQPDLAWSLEQLREGGADAFYRGSIADRIIADMEAHNGIITREDLEGYRVLERDPVAGRYQGFDVRAMSAPSSGGMHIVQMLNILDRFPIPELGYGSADAMHIMAEAMKLAYADRSKYLGDPSFVDLPVRQLTSVDYAADLAAGIDMDSARPSEEIAPGDLTAYESPETTHYSVMDAEGNAVVNTYTLMFSYGSGVVIDGAGFLMNNNMGNFTLRPDIPDAFGLMGSVDNQITAGRRPVSSMTPIIVLRDGVPYLLTGSPGGSRIITTNLQLLVNVLGHEMNIADATVRPRIHHQWQPDRLEVESGFGPDAIRILMGRGHNVVPGRAMGSLQTVLFDGNLFYGFSDPRRPGALSLGFSP
ncbi:MAG: gamma-glutamyltransferase [Gemmatimonadetes bacterium]|nr:gamma-glutamyltransferase [Gemmatimonadota bacterium]|tara:strand:+ start:2491 stop:4251 length:1761 start_codon:yes stop_codon:yes gene_type:complete